MGHLPRRVSGVCSFFLCVQTGVVNIAFLITLSNKIACNPVLSKLTNLKPKVTDFFAFINCMQIVSFGVSCPCNCITAASFLLALASNDIISTEPHGSESGIYSHKVCTYVRGGSRSGMSYIP